MTRQLKFDLTARPALGREDFYVSPANAVALSMIDAWRDWPNRKLVLKGAHGSGKTHLAYVWAEMSGARIIRAIPEQKSRPPCLTRSTASSSPFPVASTPA